MVRYFIQRILKVALLKLLVIVWIINFIKERFRVNIVNDKNCICRLCIGYEERIFAVCEGKDFDESLSIFSEKLKSTQE